MNRNKTLFICLAGATLVVAAARCSQEGAGGDNPTGVGGSGVNTSGTGGHGGSSTTGSGGASTTGSGGGGSGGSGGGANTTGSGGGGTGGTGTAGSGGSAGSAGGSAGGAGGAGGNVISVASIVPTLDGFFWVGTCSMGSASGLDCPISPMVAAAACPNSAATTPFDQRGVFRRVMHTVGGTAGTQYTINMEVRGVAGSRCYTGGRSQATTIATDYEGTTGNDGWYVGGTPLDSRWNTYEIHVRPAVAGQPVAADGSNVYYLNSFNSSAIMYCERHETFVFRYTATFPVMGGGTIEAVLHDSNCLGQQNCGAPDSQVACTPNWRSVDLTGMSPVPTSAQAAASGLASLTQPFTQTPYAGQTGGYHPQWLLLDIKTVSSP